MNAQRAYSVRTASAAYEVSETTLREAINRKALRAYRVGRSIRIGVDDLEEWFHGLTVVGTEDDR